MSDRDDERGDQSQPADPWEIPEDLAAAAGPSDAARRGRRRWRRSRREPDETQMFDPLSGDDHDGHVVEAPAWADDSTFPAEHIEAEGFTDEGGVADDHGRREPGVTGDGPTPRAGPRPEDDEDWSAAMSEASPYGVSTPEAFDALASDDADDGFDDWESFVAESATDRLPEPFDPETADPGTAPMSRREARRARKEARRAAKHAEMSDHVDDAIPGWVEGGPDETAWLEADDDLSEIAAPPVAAYGHPPDRDDTVTDDDIDDPAPPGAPDEDPGFPAEEPSDGTDERREVPVEEPPGIPHEEPVAPVEVPPEAPDEAPQIPVEEPPGVPHEETAGVGDASVSGDGPPEEASPSEQESLWSGSPSIAPDSEAGGADQVEAGAEPPRVAHGDDDGADVWLASDQPLVGEGPTPARAPAAPGPIPTAWGSGDEDWPGEGEEPVEAGYSDEAADEWATGPVAYEDEGASALAPPPDDDVEITEDMYARSVTMEHRGLAEEIFRAGEDEDIEWQAVSAAMPGLGTGVLDFGDVADLESEGDEYVEKERSDLGTRIGTGVILVGLLAGSLWVGPEAFAAFVGLLVLIALGEFYIALRLRGFRPIALFGYLAGIGCLVGVWFHGPMAIPVAVVLAAVLTYFVYAFTPLGQDALANGGLTILGVVWVTGGAAFAFPLVQAEDFRVLVITLVAIVVAMDVGAFAVGRAWGSRALAPVLSPNKSWEGLFGGIAATFAVAFAAATVFEEITTSDAMWLAAVVVVLAPLGDLAESMLKRSLQLKDMGTILPGHGGVLDRIDAFLFVLPGAWVASKVLGLIG